MKTSHRLKLGRALELFTILRNEIEAFSSSRPFSFSHAIRPATVDEVFRFAALPDQLPGRLRITPDRTDLIAHESRIVFRKPPPLEAWSLQVSEIVQHLRSALDNLTYSLAVRHSGRLSERVARDIHFPICDDQHKWGQAERKLSALHPDHRAQIEQLQPYHVDVQPSPNWGLHVLQFFNNLDKHRSIFMVGPKPTQFAIEGVQTVEEGWAPKTQVALGAIEEGTVVALCLSPVKFPDFKVSDSYCLDFVLPSVPFPKGKGDAPVVKVLSTVGHEVNTVIERLESSIS